MDNMPGPFFTTVISRLDMLIYCQFSLKLKIVTKTQMVKVDGNWTKKVAGESKVCKRKIC